MKRVEKQRNMLYNRINKRVEYKSYSLFTSKNIKKGKEQMEINETISKDILASKISPDITSGELIADIEVQCVDKTENYSQKLGNYESFSSATISKSVDSTAQSAIISIKLDGNEVYSYKIVFS